MDFYNILGVSETVTPEELKVAYKKLAMEFHPDKNPGNKECEEKFKNINAAYDILKDNQKRQQYDMERKGVRHQQGGFNPFGGGGVHFSFNTGGPGGFNIFEDIMNMHQQPRNRDVNVNYPITLEDAYNGKEAEIRYIVPGMGNKSRKINIPPGVHHGNRMKFGGAGSHDNKSFPPGDLYITIVIEKHPIFERHQDNLVMKLSIDAFDAMLGTEQIIKAIDGSDVSVKVPPATQPGQVLRLVGKGMKVFQSNAIGDLFIELGVSIPTLNDQQKEYINLCKNL